jgi:hypothetical protein
MKLAALILVSVSLAYFPGAVAQDSATGEQDPAQSFNETGKVTVEGRTVSYLIRRLPVNSFPDLPENIAKLLNERGCLIPQTYQAHRPENVIQGSFEHPGSTDWAVLCSEEGRVDLLVFLSHSQNKPVKLASAPELERIQRHGSSGPYGFDWGIDPATPAQVREAQAGMQHHPPLLDHDALVDTVLNVKSTYHFYAKSAWTVVEMPQ